MPPPWALSLAPAQGQGDEAFGAATTHIHKLLCIPICLNRVFIYFVRLPPIVEGVAVPATFFLTFTSGYAPALGA